ncbi:MAG: pyridoxal-phosphate dependent enzyme [Ardenticatenales bacterium]|nr:pyridoxal-phosphate dependent enzyme [Ardenticatenales bacterium]
MDKPLYSHTPLFESLPLGRQVKGRVWLKMDACQPTGSFKARGMSVAAQHYAAQGATSLLASSGGNAGLAVAYAGRQLGLPTTIVVPQSTGDRAKELMRQEGAEVIVHGETWVEAHGLALEIQAKTGAAYLHPFDDPIIWAGHATMIAEVVASGIRPDALVVSVGGGGLLIGMIQGLRAAGWDDVTVVAVETAGASSLAQSIHAGELVTLPSIDTIATTLGAKQVAAQALKDSLDYGVIPHVVSDKEAVDACARFLHDHRVLVEPACGASLAAVYDPIPALKDKENILVIVCGGAGITPEQLAAYQQQL